MSVIRSRALILALALLYAAGPIGASALHDVPSTSSTGQALEGHHDTDCSVCLWHATAQSGPELLALPGALPVVAEPTETPTEVAPRFHSHGSHRERAPPLL